MNNIPGWTSEDDLSVLAKLSSLVPDNGNILEIGSFLGRSTNTLFSNKKESVKLTVVDPFEVIRPYTTDFIRTIKYWGSTEMFDQACLVVDKTNSWYDGFRYCLGDNIADQIDTKITNSKNFIIDKKYDLVYIDADHTLDGVVHDIFKYSTDEILLVGDDFTYDWPGVAVALASTRQGSYRKALISPQNTKTWILVPHTGYWNTLFRNQSMCFF
jgi:hypothetical protein